MNTDTPRTDNILAALVERGIELREGTCPEVLVTEMRKMEHELNDANARVAQIEESAVKRDSLLKVVYNPADGSVQLTKP